MNLAAKLKELGLDLPAPAAPVASYVPTMRTGNLVFVSGQLPFKDGSVMNPGIAGDSVSLEDAQIAARQCALNVIAQVQDFTVKRVVKITGFVAATPDFKDHPKIVNGASELFQAVYGESGRHARAAVGVASLPLGACVEVEAIIEIEE